MSTVPHATSRRTQAVRRHEPSRYVRRPRHVRRLRSSGRTGSCRGVRRRGARSSRMSGRSGWSLRSGPVTSRSGRRCRGSPGRSAPGPRRRSGRGAGGRGLMPAADDHRGRGTGRHLVGVTVRHERLRIIIAGVAHRDQPSSSPPAHPDRPGISDAAIIAASIIRIARTRAIHDDTPRTTTEQILTRIGDLGSTTKSGPGREDEPRRTLGSDQPSRGAAVSGIAPPRSRRRCWQPARCAPKKALRCSFVGFTMPCEDVLRAPVTESAFCPMLLDAAHRPVRARRHRLGGLGKGRRHRPRVDAGRLRPPRMVRRGRTPHRELHTHGTNSSVDESSPPGRARSLPSRTQRIARSRPRVLPESARTPTSAPRQPRGNTLRPVLRRPCNRSPEGRWASPPRRPPPAGSTGARPGRAGTG